MDEAVKEYPEIPPLYGKSTISLGSLSKSGVFGDATKATKEKGEKLANYFADTMSNLVSEAYNQLLKKKN